MDLLPLNWAYIGISWILLRWHDLWSLLLGKSSGIAWVLSIVFLVITVRVILFPVFVKQIKSQRAMQNLQPQIKDLKEKYKGDAQTLQKETMELYRREKANPLMGCLPIFLQIPVFFGLFHVLRQITPVDPAARKSLTTEFFWSPVQFDSATHAKLFGAPIAAAFNSPAAFLDQLHASAVTVKIVAAVLIAIMVATTYLTQRQMIARNGPASDPTQAMIQKFMLYGIPASLLISGALFPIGVVIYWVTTNLFSMGQQFWVLSKMPPPPGSAAAVAAAARPATDPAVAKALAPKPGVKPVNPKKSGTRAAAKPPAGTAASKATAVGTTKATAKGGSKPAISNGTAKPTANGKAVTSSNGAAKSAANGKAVTSPNGAAKSAANGASANAEPEDASSGEEPGTAAGAASTGAASGGAPRRPQDNRNRKRKGGRR